ncbi:DoxX family protein [Micromonospora sp. WMMD1120]|uniref:DoxX family protein n=1 Tax=Micromonospora sp. WMMD1120 TaxID=3016106 RepID=UPI002416AC9D|nr:DoxX family protein [Micromonospora sp. WMMD1120]MDG4809524.1 DoxX family protein [Micromonospora sp. WMMD1120]
MFAAYVTLNILASLFTAIAATTYLINHEYPREQMEMKRLPLSWMPRLGATLAAGSLGLLVGFAVPLIGTLASLGLVLYFIGAFIAHARVGSRKLTGWAVFFVTVTATFVVNLAYHGIW